MLTRLALLAFATLSSTVTAFVPHQAHHVGTTFVPKTLQMGAESEVAFGDLDGTDLRIGIIKTRWNSEHVNNLVEGAKASLKACNVSEANIFETEVPGAYELPLAAKFLAMSGTVDAIVTAGVLIKGDTMHFEYICDAVSSGIMNVGLTTSTPIIFGVLTCLNEEQVVKRSTGDSNHGGDWGKTAVEMALLKQDALGMKNKKKSPMGFGVGEALKTDGKKAESIGFF